MSQIDRPRVAMLPDLLIVSTNATRAKSLADRLAADAHVMICVPAFEDLARIDRKPATVIVDAINRSRDEACADVARVSRRFTSTPLVVYAAANISVTALIDAECLGATSVTMVDARSHDCVPYRSVSEAQAVYVAASVVRLFSDAWLRRLVSICISKACSDLTVPGLGSALGMPSKKLRAALARRGLPGALDLILWARVVFAAWVLSSGWRRIHQLANDLGWRDDVPLQDAVRRFVGCSPRDLRRPDGFSSVARRFVYLLSRRAM